MNLKPGARLRSTIDGQFGTFQGWDDDGAAIILWDGTYTDPESTFHWTPVRPMRTPIRHRDGRGLGE
jgi:hypothetical protein